MSLITWREIMTQSIRGTKKEFVIKLHLSMSHTKKNYFLIRETAMGKLSWFFLHLF